MAVLGFHVVICLIAITLISKLVHRTNFIHLFITNGLYRFMAPTNQELKALLPPTKEKLNQRNRRKKREDEAVEGFNVPKSSPFQLKLIAVDVRDLVQFEMYTSLHWLCLCIPVCLTVYSLSELYNYLMPANRDFNVSIVFMLVIIMFVLQVLTALSSYLVSNVDERGFMLSIGAVYFLFSFIFAMNAHRVFDIQMLEAYDKLSTNIADFVEQAGVFDASMNIRDYRPTNPLMMYISLSIFFSLLSAMLVFPNFRCAIMYLKAVDIDGRVKRAIDHIGFLLPAFILAFFTKPIVHQLVNGPRKILTSDQLDIVRIYLIIFWVLSKFVTRISHLQAHLNLSYDKVGELQNEAGKVKNYAIQAMIYRYYRYLCCASLQYFGPAILALLFALLLKTTANLSWLGAAPGVQTAPDLSSLALTGPLRFVFDASICRAFFSFLLVVTLLINFTLQLLGVVYHSYFVGTTVN